MISTSGTYYSANDAHDFANKLRALADIATKLNQLYKPL